MGERQGERATAKAISQLRYLDEQMFRFNNRQNKIDEQRFTKVLSQVAGKRITYADLSGAGSATSC